VVGTNLVNPDFAAYVPAFGANGAAVDRTERDPGAVVAAALALEAEVGQGCALHLIASGL
jgi:hypothetical protein